MVSEIATHRCPELNLDPMMLNPRCGSVSVIQFGAAGNLEPPVTLGQHLLFPDGITVVESSALRIKFRSPQPSPDRHPSQCGGE
jgi:hypothetical protein